MTVPVALMVDLSSNNATPDLVKHYAAGYRVLALKATEGTGYTWPGHGVLADAWHRLGGIVWHYHFLHPGSVASGTAQADYFWNATRAHMKTGDRLVCDVETKGETGKEVVGFIARIDLLAPGVPGLIYGGPYFLRDNGIRPVHGWGLWLADYSPKPHFVPPGWKRWDAHQFTDNAAGIAGIPGAVDCSRLAATVLPAPVPHHNPYPTPDYDRQHIDFEHLTAVATDPVRWVQWALHVPVTGRVDVASQRALVKFKVSHHLPATAVVDGPTGRGLAQIAR